MRHRAAIPPADQIAEEFVVTSYHFVSFVVVKSDR